MAELKSYEAMVVQFGCTAMGGRRFGSFSAKPSLGPTRKVEGFSDLDKVAENDGAHGPVSTWALWFDGLGLKTITRLLWVGRGLDKIETLKVSDGRVVDIARLRRS